MEKKRNSTKEPGKSPGSKETEAKKNLSQPPRDKREIVIGPPAGSGPDVNVEER
jgi:hypothetical protein